ncbi:MAG TPA: 5-amino-6-(D-ribitylamino)uracil--L-tyrosine 4-hydroxyphenyl transferase CofH [Methanobacterium sp.]|nr:5-amino-6-(D-ribitylamino)uracil--L-tyrosine 4-hydroxyphenyl transferase CofH [Methanobacterium sp.]
MQDICRLSIQGDIDREDALKLVNSNPFQLFNLADRLRQEIVGDEVSFVVNRNVDITDNCMIKCNFCSFRDSIGYHMTTEEILDSIGEAVDIGASEVCLFGGVTPEMTVEYYCNLFADIKNEYSIDIHGLSPVEVYYAAQMSGVTTEEALKEFKKAGLDTMTGASAEILVDSVRAKICPNKISTEDWVKIIKEAHKTGLRSTSTIMYGTLETWEDRIDHLFILRDIQRETGGFTELVPLTFLNKNNLLGKEFSGSTGMDDLKIHAIARVIFGKDIPNIQASWIKLGTKLAQIALCCGANDLGGTMMEDKISIAAGSSHGEHLPREEMHKLITAIDRIPIERNTLYQTVKK